MPSETVDFEIEMVLRPKGLVIARCLSTGRDWEVKEGSTLSGLPLKRFLDMPRAQDADGSQRYDLFIFALKRPEDADKLAVGQRVTLD